LQASSQISVPGSSVDSFESYKRSFPLPEELPTSIEALAEGAWALFFFPKAPRKPLENISAVPKNTDAAKKLLQARNAQTVVESWYDDIEWTIVSLNPPT
jgi:hypothetical protein